MILKPFKENESKYFELLGNMQQKLLMKAENLLGYIHAMNKSFT